MKNFQCTRVLKQQDGSMMVVVLMIMAILSIIGIHSITISSTEQQITINSQTQQTAFYDADSGVQYTLGCIENDLKNGVANVLPTSVDPNDPGNTVAVTYATPAGSFFVISDIEMLASGSGGDTYGFTSTGNAENAHGNLQAVINVTFRKDESSPFRFAAFGDKLMDIRNSGVTQSYDSDSTDPTKNDPDAIGFTPTGAADVGSNESLIAKNNAQIDGNGIIGEASDGTPGTANINSGAIFSGEGAGDSGDPYEPLTPGRIDSDPLGIDTPDGAYNPESYSSTGIFGNDNDGISESLTLRRTTLTLSENADGSTANYYFTDITLKQGAQLIIDGNVNIFITGKLDARNGTDIVATGSPQDFAIYSSAQGSPGGDFVFHNSSEFNGVVYAPKSKLEMKNSAAIYGAVWGSEMVFHNSFNLFYDEALQNKYTTESDDVSLASWEEVQ